MTGIQGIQLSIADATVTWANGAKTVLPTVLNPAGQNILADDSELVVKMTKHLFASEESSMVNFLSSDSFTDKKSLLYSVRQLLATGWTVVVEGYAKNQKMEFTMKDLEMEFEFMAKQKVDMHGQFSCL